jgi:hypothetical protein
MAKIGTAHVEIKPVLDEAALAAIVSRIETDIREAVSRALAADRAES